MMETDVSPRKPVFLYTGGAILLLAILGAIALYLMRGSHLELTGTVGDVRTLASDDTHTIAVIDFKVTDVADVPWTVRHVGVSVTTADGQVLEGTPVAEMDAQRLFDYYPSLGKKSPTLRMKETIQGHQTQDRMIAAQFDAPEEVLKKRKELTIHIDELDGASSDITQRSRW